MLLLLPIITVQFTERTKKNRNISKHQNHLGLKFKQQPTTPQKKKKIGKHMSNIK